MVGIIDDTAIRYPFGTRIKVGDNFGTVKYVGEVAGYAGIWLGIEWDESHRGKHDGSLNGKRYFSTFHPTAGSFIRESKLTAFVSLEDAIREKYLSYEDGSLDETLISKTQQSLKASIFKVVGMEKIARKQSKFEELSAVCVDGCPVNSAGYLQDFHVLSTLNLNHTLVWNWKIVADICQQIPTLTNLDLSCNRLLFPKQSQIAELEPSFRSLKHINLGNFGIRQWSEVLQIASLLKNIESVGLQENHISSISSDKGFDVFRKLKELDLSQNKLDDFNEIVKLGSIDTLTSLILMGNGITEIKLPDCAPFEKLDTFTSLEHLDLLCNPIWNESDAFNELDKLPCLKKIAITPHLKSDFDEMFSKAVAHITRLEVINKALVSGEERRGAEYDMWKKYAVEWMESSKNPETLNNFYKKHRSYAQIIKKYGSPAEFIPQNIKPQSKLIRVCVKCEKTGETWEKKIPRMITVQTLLGLIAKRFHLENSNTVKLSYIDAEYPEINVPLDNTSKTLDYYSLRDGDIVLVQS